MKFSSHWKSFLPLLLIMSGCENPVQDSSKVEPDKQSTLAVAAATSSTIQNATWYTLNSAESYDVAVGSRNNIYIINNNYDAYYWTWKYGSYRPGDPAGGAWVKMPGLPGTKFSRIAAGETNQVAALGQNGNVYKYNGSTWSLLPYACSGAGSDVAVSPTGNISASFLGCNGPTTGIYDWNGSAWSNFTPGGWGRIGLSISLGHLAKSWDNLNLYQFKNGTFQSLGVTAKDIGGIDQRLPDHFDNEYETWRTDQNGIVFHLYTGRFGVDNHVESQWFQTNGVGTNIAASRKNDVVIVQANNRKVWFSTDFRF
jgi:hypothetical protein